MLVKIAAAFLDDARAPARLFVMDEPTAALAGEDAERLFQVIGELKRRPCGVIYVSHWLDEVVAIADRITVLRDGENRATLAAREATKSGLIEAMTVRESVQAQPHETTPHGDIVLSIKNIEAPGLRNVSFNLRAGESLGCVGLAGAGHERLLNALTGAARSGEVAIGGVKRRLREPADAWSAGLALAPRRGIVADAGHFGPCRVAASPAALSFGNFPEPPRAAGAGRGDGRQGSSKIDGACAKDPHAQRRQPEKVMFARAVAGSPRALLLDESIRGVDVGAKFDIYALLREQAAADVAIVVVSCDHEEVLALCTHVAFFRNGRLIEPIPNSGLTTRALLVRCYGEAER